jgi:hypothetical protein
MEKTSNKHQHFTEIHSAASSNLVVGTSKSFKIPRVSSENFLKIFLHSMNGYFHVANPWLPPWQKISSHKAQL